MAEVKALNLTNLAPILIVRDVRRSVDYYTRTLGFEHPWTWAEPPTHGGVSLERAQIQFSQNPDLSRPGMGLFFFVEQVDRWHAFHRARDAEIFSPLEGKPWGMREYTVRDPDGYELRFGEGGSDRTPPQQPKELPAGVEITFDTPPLAEYEAMVRLMGWESFTNFDNLSAVLERAACTVVARLDGKFIGMAILTCDGAGTYYVRDVMVHPDHQAKGIGTQMMRTLVEHFHATAPEKSMVFLLTGRSRTKFYEQFGFVGSDRGLWGMSMGRR